MSNKEILENHEPETHVIKKTTFSYFKVSIIFLVLASLTVIFAISIRNSVTEINVESPLIGKRFPDFTLERLAIDKTGKNKDDSPPKINKADILGKISLVNVWASWCNTCVAENKTLLRIASEGKIQIIGINYKDSKEGALGFLNKYKNPFAKIIFDSQGSLGIDLGVYAVPESFIIDEKGTIVYKHTGQMTYDNWLNKILPAIENATLKKNHEKNI